MDRDEPETGRTGEHFGASAAAGIQLIIRAPSCSSTATFLMMTGECWLAEFHRMTVRPSASEEKPETRPVTMHDLSDLTPDSPPPRVG